MVFVHKESIIKADGEKFIIVIFSFSVKPILTFGNVNVNVENPGIGGDETPLKLIFIFITLNLLSNTKVSWKAPK